MSDLHVALAQGTKSRYLAAPLAALFVGLAILVSGVNAAPASTSVGQDFFLYTPPPGYGQFTIAQVTIPQGAPTGFQYIGAATTILRDGDWITYDVPPGVYVVGQILPQFWSLVSITCNDSDSSGDLAKREATFNVAASEYVVCWFRNEKWAETFLPMITN